MNIFTKFDNGYDRDKANNTLYLDDKVECFYNWIFKYKSNGFGLDIKKLVEKVLLWYEFRYPDKYFDLEDVDQVMFEGIQTKGCNKLEWCDLFNYKKFYYMLSGKERSLLDKPKFPNMVDLYSGSRNHFHVDDDGIINDSDDVWVRRKNPGDVMSCGIFFNGKSLRDVEKINIENNLGLNVDNVKKIVSRIEYEESIREGLLDTIMYRIMESGGKFYGPRRAVLFAKEFERDIRIPVRYGDASLINDYVMNGGSGELICYINYYDGENVLSRSALEILSNQNLIGDNGKVKRKVFIDNK